MQQLIRTTYLAFQAILPNALKIWLMRSRGARIGRGCKIGISIIDAKNVDIGEYVSIGNFNLIYKLNTLRMESGSKIDSFNWITGAKTGDFRIGKNSSIRRFHFFEGSGSLSIGDNSIVAGRSSLFFTHGLTPSNLDDIRPISIGNWCYIGAASRFLPGASIGDGTFVGMGSVVTKPHASTFVLLAGNPAVVRKELSSESPYFNRPFLRHASHPASYGGGRSC